MNQQRLKEVKAPSMMECKKGRGLVNGLHPKEGRGPSITECKKGRGLVVKGAEFSESTTPQGGEQLQYDGM